MGLDDNGTVSQVVQARLSLASSVVAQYPVAQENPRGEVDCRPAPRASVKEVLQ